MALGGNKLATIRRLRLPLALGLTLVLSAILLRVGLPFRALGSGADIISLELASSAREVGRILDIWRGRGLIGAAETSLWFDFPFILAYCATILLSCKASARLLGVVAAGRRFWGIAAKAVSILGTAQVLTGLCDAAENVALLYQIHNRPDDAWAAVNSGAAKVKFALVIAGASAGGLALLSAGLLHKDRRTFLQYLFLCRFPLLMAFALAVLGPVCVLGAPSLLGSLFDLDFGGIALATAGGLLLAWTSLLTLRNILDYADERTGVEELPRAVPGWLHRHRPVIAAFLATPLVLTALVRTEALSPWHAVGVAAGVVLTVLVLLLAETVRAYLVGGAKRRSDRVFDSVRVEQFAASRAKPPLLSRMVKLWIGWALRRLSRQPGYGSNGHVYSGHAQALAFAAASVVFYVLGYVVPRGRLPAVAYLLLILIAVTWLLQLLSFFLDRCQVPTSLFLVLAATVTGAACPTDHYYRVGRDDLPPLSPAEALDANDRVLGDNGPVIVVAASGGGIRAALWTATVLSELERASPRFAPGLRLVSSVSGGSVGTLFYLDSWLETPRPSPDAIAARASDDSLDATAWGLAYPDLWQGLLGGLRLWLDWKLDRGWALEDTWDRRLAVPERRMGDWRAAVCAGRLPPAILNATIIETGEQLFLTPLDAPAGRAPGLWPGRSLPYDLRVATAARLSATFPWVSPVARARSEESRPKRRDLGEIGHLHVGDGGYYDNSGIVSAIHWLETVAQTHEARLARYGVVLVVVSASPEDAPPPVEGAKQGWFFATLAPILALNHVRDSTQSDRNALEVRLLKQRWQGRVVIDDFRFRFTGEGPLSWKLTPTEKDGIRNAWNTVDNQKERERLRTALGAVVPQGGLRGNVNGQGARQERR